MVWARFGLGLVGLGCAGSVDSGHSTVAEMSDLAFSFTEVLCSSQSSRQFDFFVSAGLDDSSSPTIVKEHSCLVPSHR